MLKVSGVSKAFVGGSKGRTIAAVQNVSFDIEPGQFFTLLGPSGCGKTTLLRSVAGLEQPDAGEIWIDGGLVFGARQGIRTEAERRPIGMVFQSYAIWPHMKVFDNVAFPLVYGRHKLPAATVKTRVRDMLERVSLAEYADHWATRLSGGQQQRLALARALVSQPKVLLLDEPLSNLDAALRKTMRQALKECQRSFGVTTLYVTHDQSEALALSDRVAVLRSGKIMQVGTPREIYEAPREGFVARFVGNANVLRARVIDGGADPLVETAFGVVRCYGQSASPGDSVACFVRPECLRVGPSQSHGGSQSAAGVTVRITALDYVGERQECTVTRGADELRGWAPADMPFNVGDEATINLEQAGIRLLPDGAEAGSGSPVAGVDA